MTDITTDKTTTAPNIPNKPPKSPERDYSALPQKPITLKHKQKKATVKKQKSTAQPSKQKGKSTSNKKTDDSWHLEGVSNEVKATITAEADRQGLSVGAYLEKLIIQQHDTATAGQLLQLDTELHDRINSLERRLDRIEAQKGFWGSFWEKVISK
jgi:hypothetical protein